MQVGHEVISQAGQRGRLPTGWRLADFSEFMKRTERRIALDDATCYRCVGVRWYGRGAFIREELFGKSITRKQQWVIRAGDVVYNKLFAWKGAFAVANDTVDGCIVSDKFPTYTADPSVVDPVFLAFHFRTHQLSRQAEILSQGAAAVSKLTLNPPQFWKLRIPIPDIAEQRRISKRLSEQVAQAEEIREAAMLQAKAAKALPASLLRQVFDSDEAMQWPTVPLGKVCEFLPARSIRSDGNTNVLAVTTACLGETGFLPAGLKEARMDSADASETALRAGEILIARSNTPELVGRVAQYLGHPSPIVASDLTIRVWPTDPRIRGGFLAAYLSKLYTTGFWRQKAGGTSGTMKKITRRLLTEQTIPVPSIAEQERLVQQLGERMAHTHRLREAAEAQLEAVNALPNLLLEEVFGGLEPPT